MSFLGAGGRHRLDQPVSLSERQAVLLVAISVLLVAAALLLAATDARLPGGAGTRSHIAAPPRTDREHDRPEPLHAREIARRFLVGYLRFLYGQAPAGSVHDSTEGFELALARAKPAPPGLGALHPRIVALQVADASARSVEVKALVKDGEVLVYPITLRLTLNGGRLLVAEVGS